MKINITIDGPAGSGKSTIAKLFCNHNKNFIYVNTGSMFRAIAYYLFINKIDYLNIKSVNDSLDQIHIKLKDDYVYLNDVEISKYLRTSEIETITCTIATYDCVRDKLLSLQREIAKTCNVIMDGRDIGSTVLPNADIKIYLDANVEIRAQRRLEQFNEQKSVEEIKQEIILRDENDKNRKKSPLTIPNNCIIIDTSNLTIQEVINKINYIYKNFLHKKESN